MDKSNYSVRFYSESINSLVSEYSLFPNGIPENLASLTKSKDNDLLLVNTLKSEVVPLLPRDLEDPKRLDLLKVIKEIHEQQFHLVDESNAVIYSGKPQETSSEPVNEPTASFSLGDLLKKKETLEAELLTVNSQLDNQIEEAWLVIDKQIAQLEKIKAEWRDLKANVLGSNNLNTLAKVSEQIKNINLPTLS